MTNDNSTLSAQRIMRPLPMTEKNTVERAIEIEDRMEEIENELRVLDIVLNDIPLSDEAYAHYNQKSEELESELSDLEREYRG